MTEPVGNILEFSSSARKSAKKRFAPSDLDYFENEDFSVAASKINLSDELSRGSYGVVYKGYMEGNTYAIKVEDFVAGQEQTNMLIELSLLQSLSHPRVVQFCGASYVSKSLAAGAKVMVLMELCENGAMREFLQRPLFSSPSKRSWNVLLRLCSDVAEGLDFLHQKKIVHRDVKTTNILVDADWRAKLCGFSFASHENSPVSAKKEYVYGTEEFMAPEIAMGADFGVSADMFSFGMVLCEVVTRKQPGANFLHRQPQKMFALNEAELREHVLPGCPDDLQVMALQCCDVDPAYRPSAAQSLEILRLELSALGSADEVERFVEEAKQNPAAGDVGISSPNREGTVKYPRTLQLDSLRAAMWGASAGACSGAGTDTASGGRTLDEVVAMFENRFACMDLELQQVRAENRKLQSGMNALLAQLAVQERGRGAEEQDDRFKSSPGSTGEDQQQGSASGNDAYYRERMASIGQRLRDSAEQDAASRSPDESMLMQQQYEQQQQQYGRAPEQDYDQELYAPEEEQYEPQDQDDHQHGHHDYNSRAPEDDEEYDQREQQMQLNAGPEISREYEYELGPRQEHYEQQYMSPEEQGYGQSPQRQSPQSQPYSGNQSSNTKAALQSFLSSVSKAKVHTSRTLRAVDQSMLQLPTRSPSMQNGPSRGSLVDRRSERRWSDSGSQTQSPPPVPSQMASTFDGVSPDRGMSQAGPMQSSELSGQASPSFSYSRSNSPLSTRRKAGNPSGFAPDSSVRGFSGPAAASIIAAAALSVDQRPQQPSPGAPGAYGGSRQRPRPASPSSISGASVHSTVSMSSKGPASVLSSSTHHPISTKKNVVVHSVPASPRRTTGSQGGFKPADMAASRGSPRSPVGAVREPHTPASAMATWRDNKTPFVRGIAPTGSGQRGREQLRVNTSGNLPERERDRSVSPTSTIRSNTTSGTVGMGFSRLPPPPATTRSRSPRGTRDPNFNDSSGADTFFHVDPQDVRIDMDYESFQKHRRQRTHQSPLHRPSSSNGNFNRSEVAAHEIERAVDFQGGLRLRDNLMDYNQGAVAGRKTVVTPIVGLVPSPRGSPQHLSRSDGGGKSSPAGSTLGTYLKQR